MGLDQAVKKGREEGRMGRVLEVLARLLFRSTCRLSVLCEDQERGKSLGLKRKINQALFTYFIFQTKKKERKKKITKRSIVVVAAEVLPAGDIITY